MTRPSGAPKVLVLGKEDRAFLAVVRSLGRKGMRVHLAWCPPEALARVPALMAILPLAATALRKFPM